MKNLCVARLCKVQTPDGEVYTTMVGVKRPEQLGPLQWRCPIDLGAIDHAEKVGFGADSWQAMQIGMQIVYVELRRKELDGWCFSWSADEDDDSDLVELLPRIGRQLPEW